MMEAMEYHGREPKFLIVFPQVAQAIMERREALNIPVVQVKELEYGLDEVMNVSNPLRGKLLTGKQATLLGFLSILKEEPEWDCIWLITHGEAEGFYLNDGLVNASEFTALVRSSGAWLTVMNSCESYHVATAIAHELGTAFICTITEVPDRAALITGTLFARHIASGMDYVSAYEKAKLGQVHPYVLIEATGDFMSDRRGQNPSPTGGPQDQGIQRFYATVQELQKTVNDLDVIVNGSPRLGVSSIKDTIRDVNIRLNQFTIDLRDVASQLQEVKEKVEEGTGTPNKWRDWLTIGMAVAIVFLLIAQFFTIAAGGIR